MYRGRGKGSCGYLFFVIGFKPQSIQKSMKEGSAPMNLFYRYSMTPLVWRMLASAPQPSKWCFLKVLKDSTTITNQSIRWPGDVRHRQHQSGWAPPQFWCKRSHHVTSNFLTYCDSPLGAWFITYYWENGQMIRGKRDGLIKLLLKSEPFPKEPKNLSSNRLHDGDKYGNPTRSEVKLEIPLKKGGS